jgi:HEAT repeat protein
MSAPEAYTITEAERIRLDEVRRLETRGVGSIPPLLGMLSDPSWVVRRSVVEALAAMGEPAIEPLCEMLCSRRDHEARIAALVDALVGSRGAAEVALERLAEHPDPAILADVAQILGRRRNPASTRTLVRLTQHVNDNVAVSAIEALGRIGGRAAIEALIEAVGSGSFFRTFPAIDVLGRSGDPRAVEPLTRLLSEPNYLPEAARALGRSGERGAVKPLTDLLISPSDAVVRVAAVSLADLRERFEEKSSGGAVIVEELFRAQVAPEVLRRLTRVLSGADASEMTARPRWPLAPPRH